MTRSYVHEDEPCTAMQRAYLEEFVRFLRAGGGPDDMNGRTVAQRLARQGMARTLDQVFAEVEARP